ncbi:MAG: 50S ribosomal protein L11 methyltransferase [Desulfosalsimonas sp.]
MTPDDQAGKEKVKYLAVEHVRKSSQRLTPLDLERRVSAETGISGKTARKIIKSLVSENQLSYTQHLGRTFVDISTNRPVRVGHDIILAPPDIAVCRDNGRTLVRIAPGASFGIGDHATTRIALQLISRVFRGKTLPCPPEDAVVLDIGTGTGILAIAACLMGAGRAMATDTDPCARSEAAHNVCLNGLEGRIHISSAGQGPEALPRTLQPPFSLILANLRYPTLARLHDEIARLAAAGTVVIFSGFRDHEAADLVQIYDSCGFRCTDELRENAWCGMTMEKEAN